MSRAKAKAIPPSSRIQLQAVLQVLGASRPLLDPSEPGQECVCVCVLKAAGAGNMCDVFRMLEENGLQESGFGRPRAKPVRRARKAHP